MAQIQQTDVRNGLLKVLSVSDFALLEPKLRPLLAPLRMTLYAPNKPIEQAYFPEQGFASITSGNVEVGMIGREGMVGASPIVLGDQYSPCECHVQMEGHGLQISALELRQASEQSRSFNNLLLRYVQSFLVQTAQTASANASYSVEVRLARWLLMGRDRAEDDDMALTHELLSVMLGVRRAGVTVGIHRLEGKHLIKATRGRIRILDRKSLEDAAQGSYGVAESEYARLIDSR